MPLTSIDLSLTKADYISCEISQIKLFTSSKLLDKYARQSWFDQHFMNKN